MGRAILLRGLLALSSLLNFSDGARILFIVGTPSYSHQVVFQPVWRELSLRGHQVTAITTNPLKDPALTNLTEIDTSFSYDLMENKYKAMETLDTLKDDSFKFGRFFLGLMSAINEDQLSCPEVRKLIDDRNEHFDLVMVEYLLPTMLAFGHRFKCPIIALTSLDASIAGHESVGNPLHPVLNPDSLLRFNLPLTYKQRVVSTLYGIFRRILYYFLVRNEDAIVAKHFGEGYPSLGEIRTNIDMFFMNVNPALHNVRPTVPAVVHIGGGMHIKKPKPLPEDLKTFLDGASNGAIYFSLGSNIRTQSLTKQFMQSITSAFAELPYKVLWKFDEELADKPDNVLVKKWLPQQDILRHPNVKLFITPGGLQSIEETINATVPLIVFPFCSDQFSNAALVQRKGFGLHLDHHTADKDAITAAILEVIKNPKYKNKVTKLARIAQDQPMTGLEKAVWWTEYVLRHKGAKHLRSPAIDVPLYQYFLLDVIGFLVVTTIVLAYVIIKAVKLCYFGAKKYLSDGGKKIKKN